MAAGATQDVDDCPCKSGRNLSQIIMIYFKSQLRNPSCSFGAVLHNSRRASCCTYFKVYGFVPNGIPKACVFLTMHGGLLFADS